jgi:uncharacterized protein (TIGR04222 family)
MYRRVLLLLTLFLVTAVAPALAARSLVIQEFDADILVNPDATIDVTETIRPQFTGSWNGIYRTVPVEYRTSQGFNFTLFLDLVSITDDAGNPLRHQQSRERHYQKIKIWVPGATDATRTVILKYRAKNGLKFFEDHDELYWNITGDEWEVPIRSATARIYLPQGSTGLRAVAFTGGYGSREQAASITLGENEVRVRTTRVLNFREGLTVAVAWNPGLVYRPGALQRVAWFLHSNWVTVLLFSVPLAVFVIMFRLWYTRGRDPRRRPIAPQYEPPEGLTPAELGTLADNSPDMRDISATLVDLAVRGYILIEEKEESTLLGLRTAKDYVFHLRKQESDWKDLKAHERSLLDSLFAGGHRTSVELSDLENSFYRELPAIRDRIFERLLERRYYTKRPDKVRQGYLVTAAAVAFLSLWGGGILTAIFSLGPHFGMIAVAGLLSAAIIFAFGWVMPARTLRGARALDGILGFEEFLSRVEGDRLQRMVKTPEMFEKFLPYAMALGVEKNWARAFVSIYKQAPEWYRGTHFDGFSSRSFVSNLSSMSGAAATAMASSPRSSSGSGFSGGGGGGGSSGGGMGGGGGGGF